MAQYNIRNIDDMTVAINRFYKEIDDSYITEDGWKQLPIDNSKSCFINEPIEDDPCNNEVQKSREEKKLIADKKRIKDRYQELEKEAKHVRNYDKDLKKTKKQDTNKYEDLQKRYFDMEDNLNSQINQLKEEKKQMKEAFEQELNKSYIEWADTYKTLSQNPSYADYDQLRRRQLINVEMAQKRHKSLEVLCENSILLKRALSVDHKEYQSCFYDKNPGCRKCDERSRKEQNEKTPLFKKHHQEAWFNKRQNETPDHLKVYIENANTTISAPLLKGSLEMTPSTNKTEANSDTENMNADSTTGDKKIANNLTPMPEKTQLKDMITLGPNSNELTQSETNYKLVEQN